MDFQTFIGSRKKALMQALRDKVTVDIVLGNESCDLDSAVSALAYAFLLQKECDREVIPVFNVYSHNYFLKTEVTYMMSSHGLSQSDLIFLHDLDMLRQGQGYDFNVHLVDHNVPTDTQLDMADRVKSVVDHHNRDCPPNDKIFIRIETVGSCCSIITDLFYERCGTVYSKTLAQLLRGTILGDSICLSEEAGKVKPLDIAMVEKLEEEFQLDPSTRQDIFNQINTAKQDISGLSTNQILNKDRCCIRVQSTVVVLSAVPVTLKALLDREDLILSCPQALVYHAASVLIILCSGGKDGVSVKHFVMYTRDQRLRASLTELIDSDLDLQFTPTQEFPQTDPLVIRKFLNTKISRKQVLPKIKGFLEVIMTSDDLVTKLRADSDQLTFSLELSAPGTPAVLDSPAPELYSSHENSGCHTPNPTFHMEAPPNSFKDASMLDSLGPHLPSFNNSEMVKRIMIKKNKLASDQQEDHLHGDVLSSGSNSGHNSCPFTPANSFVDKFAPLEHHLPSFNNREMVFRMMQKKIPLDDISPADYSHPQQIFTPHNSECDGELHSSPAFDQLDLEHRLSTFEASDLYNSDGQRVGRVQDTAHAVVDGALEQAFNTVTISDDNHYEG